MGSIEGEDDMFKYIVIVLLLLGSTQVQAAEDHAPCQALGVFIGAVGGYAAGGPAGPAIQAGLTAVGASFGDAALSASCSRAADEFAEYYQQNPVDYDDFVENQCGGNPANCPGNLSPFPSPYDCVEMIDCIGGRVPSGYSVSVQDLIDGAYYVQISLQNGYWVGGDPFRHRDPGAGWIEK